MAASPSGQEIGTAETASTASLAPLREELTLYPGPTDATGAPTWSLQDPVRNLFFRIDWPTFEILARWHLADVAQIVSDIEDATTLSLDDADVANVQRFLSENELLCVDDVSGSRRYALIAQKRRAGWARWLLHHYLFFRIPLFRPDRLLTSLLLVLNPLFSKEFLKLTLLVFILGMVEVIRQWEHFSATLIDTFTWQGIAGYGIALVFVKILHEFGHALTAKRAGCRVPVMGIAFLVMWPMAYTDVNETWKLPDRRRRLMVSGAGIATELIVAAWATLAWAVMPEGGMRGVMFLLCTTTWVSTLIINASPFMRFDGYFLLCDLLDMPNLHQRSFALARWRMREALFGLNDPAPEYFSIRRQTGLIIFAYATWVYRLVIFAGIAVLVYEYFVKLLGVFLFAVEIAWFIAMPMWSEVRLWWARRDDIRTSRRARRTGLGVIFLLMLAVIPWRITIESQGMLRPARTFDIVTPASTRVEALPLGHGSLVRKGDLLLNLDAPELVSRERALLQHYELLRFQASAASIDHELKPRRLVFEQELTGLLAQLEGVRDELSRLNPTAPFDGMLFDLPPDLNVGNWLPKNTRVATLVDLSAWRVETFLPENQVARVALGDHGRFISETAGGASYWLVVERIDADATRVMPEPMLSALHGGQILTRERNRALVPDQAMYRVSLRVLDDPGPHHVLRGKVVIWGQANTVASDFLRGLAGLLIRETGF